MRQSTGPETYAAAQFKDPKAQIREILTGMDNAAQKGLPFVFQGIIQGVGGVNQTSEERLCQFVVNLESYKSQASDLSNLQMPRQIYWFKHNGRGNAEAHWDFVSVNKVGDSWQSRLHEVRGDSSCGVYSFIQLLANFIENIDDSSGLESYEKQKFKDAIRAAFFDLTDLSSPGRIVIPNIQGLYNALATAARGGKWESLFNQRSGNLILGGSFLADFVEVGEGKDALQAGKSANNRKIAQVLRALLPVVKRGQVDEPDLNKMIKVWALQGFLERLGQKLNEDQASIIHSSGGAIYRQTDIESAAFWPFLLNLQGQFWQIAYRVGWQPSNSSVCPQPLKYIADDQLGLACKVSGLGSLFPICTDPRQAYDPVAFLENELRRQALHERANNSPFTPSGLADNPSSNMAKAELFTDEQAEEFMYDDVPDMQIPSGLEFNRFEEVREGGPALPSPRSSTAAISAVPAVNIPTKILIRASVDDSDAKSQQNAGCFPSLTSLAGSTRKNTSSKKQDILFRYDRKEVAPESESRVNQFVIDQEKCKIAMHDLAKQVMRAAFEIASKSPREEGAGVKDDETSHDQQGVGLTENEASFFIKMMKDLSQENEWDGSKLEEGPNRGFTAWITNKGGASAIYDFYNRNPQENASYLFGITRLEYDNNPDRYIPNLEYCKGLFDKFERFSAIIQECAESKLMIDSRKAGFDKEGQQEFLAARSYRIVGAIENSLDYRQCLKPEDEISRRRQAGQVEPEADQSSRSQSSSQTVRIVV